jgi:EAL domain-containing protein (putative c-di-GMP-specific phosphodiesterase class I)
MAAGHDSCVKFFRGAHAGEERLLWTRDARFGHRLAMSVPGGRMLDLESGVCLIGPAAELTDQAAAEVARSVRSPEYGLVSIDPAVSERERYLVAFSAAVQLSGIADRIGMAQSTHMAMTKTLDYFFTLKNQHEVHFQPIVELTTGHPHEYECLFRPVMPMLPQSITGIVSAAIATDRSVELDRYILSVILPRLSQLNRAREAAGLEATRFSINLTPQTLLAPILEPHAFVDTVRDAGLDPGDLTLECTEQQAVSDLEPLQRRAKQLRRLGFGFAIDDAGAGYASFTMIAALRPSIIKIDREIVHGIGSKSGDAKQALVEAFVSFGQRIGARLVAEGIETRRDLSMLTGLGVDFGQGFLLGRPAADPQPARPFVGARLADRIAARRASATSHHRPVHRGADAVPPPLTKLKLAAPSD